MIIELPPMVRENTVYVGRKPPGTYVVAGIIKLETNDVVYFSGRGRRITTLVDTVQLLKNEFIPDVNVVYTAIGTDEFKEKEDRTRHVSKLVVGISKKEYPVKTEVLETEIIE